jgi:hypothetical protein
VTACARRSGALHCTAQVYWAWWGKDTAHPGHVVRRTGYRLAAVSDTAPATSSWTRSRWATAGIFRSSGARWRVTCSSASGARTCTAQRLEQVIVRVRSASGYRFVVRQQWATRHLVRLTRR